MDLFWPGPADLTMVLQLVLDGTGFPPVLQVLILGIFHPFFIRSGSPLLLLDGLS